MMVINGCSNPQSINITRREWRPMRPPAKDKRWSEAVPEPVVRQSTQILEDILAMFDLRKEAKRKLCELGNSPCRKLGL